jgi:nitrate reductase NapE component
MESSTDKTSANSSDKSSAKVKDIFFIIAIIIYTIVAFAFVANWYNNRQEGQREQVKE